MLKQLCCNHIKYKIPISYHYLIRNLGEIYNCIITLRDKNTLQVREYIEFSFLGRTEVGLRE